MVTKKVKMITYDMEDFLVSTISRYADVCSECGYSFRLKKVATPFLDDEQLRSDAEARSVEAAKSGALTLLAAMRAKCS